MEITQLLDSLEFEPSEKYESESIEFKNYSSEQALHNAKDLAEEISALANKKGGKIIVGVIDSSNVSNQLWNTQLNGFVSVDLDTTKERLQGKLNPRIPLKLLEHNHRSKNYLVIEVPNINHTLVATSSGKICIRHGKSSYPAPPDEIAELVKNLQSYDWSAQEINGNPKDYLNETALGEAKNDLCIRREIDTDSLSDENFLESIGATKNGVLNYGGLLFLGKESFIQEILGTYESRFSWKTNDGQLKINDVWSDCIWNTIIRAKKHFKKCNSSIIIEYKKNNYELWTLDDIAFHEAYLNSIVHRDYSMDGMNIVNFKGSEITITNPGTFYGGVNSDNISYHEPRHRNKTLAKILMDFQLVDRAGMGVLRMGLNSLKYGREFPVFKENLGNIEVTMAAEYFKSGVFILTQSRIPKCGITELYILNNLYKTGKADLIEIETDLSKIIPNTWNSIQTALNRDEMKRYLVLKGNNDGVFICPNEMIQDLFEVEKTPRASTNSSKHIKLFKFLKSYDAASNEEIMKHLGFASSASTYQFLNKLKYVQNTGKSRKSRWKLKNN
ncbi:RNA-binding domain-containing protein [Algibacter sp. AS12]|uniref:RNA-binding domain-containing protein n=1 Tax=Algibacter sp. AS12 TaxID=3135773 RepID=UPI00398AE877